MRLVDHVRLTPCTKSKIPARVTAQSGFYTMADGTTKVAYQSALECDFVKICDFANEVQLVHWEPFSIRFDDLIDRRERIYTPDYLVETIDDEGHRNTLIVEVKPQKEIRAIWQRDPTGSAARAYKAMLEWLYGKAPRREDRIDPSKTAHLTLNEFLGEIIRYCVNVYAHTPHSALGMTPAEKWAEGIHEFGQPRLVDDPERFYLDFLQAKQPTLQKYGVRISYLTYADRKLQPLLNGRLTKPVYVKRDPGDVSRAFVEDPRDGSYIEVWNEVTRGHDITVAEWEEARTGLSAELKKSGRHDVDLTATGILGYLRKERNRRSVGLNGASTKSKLTRAAVKKAEHAKAIKKRSAERLPRSIPANPPPPAPMFDLAELRQF